MTVFKTVSNRDSLVLRLVTINWLCETRAGDLVIACTSGHADQGSTSAKIKKKSLYDVLVCVLSSYYIIFAHIHGVTDSCVIVPEFNF